jgi:plastocyanin
MSSPAVRTRHRTRSIERRVVNKVRAVLAVIVALVASVLACPAARAGPGTLTIRAGAVHPTNRDAPYVYTRYYPDVLQVHRGQTVRWTFEQTHSVTFSKAARPGWYRPDEIPDTYAVDERFGFGATDCGLVGLKPCTFTASTAFLSSGVSRVRQEQPFEVRVDAPPGTYTYFCTLHPAMSGAIQVVRDTVVVRTQKQLDAYARSDVRADSKAADAVFRADQKPVSTVDAGGRRVWRGLLGDSTPDKHVSIVAFMPADLDAAAGDKVRYVFRDHAINEPHTVTFPTEVSGGPPPGPVGLGTFALFPACDFDGRTSGLPGVRGLWGASPVPACPANFEVLHAPWMTRGHPAPGNQVMTPATYHDSGLLIPRGSSMGMRRLPDTGRVLPWTFEAEFPNTGSFKFECNLHADVMTGSVNVS